ncbi:MAG: hypothetical protein KGH71_00815 [Candidatus Micrarchaeota archaeon]|nr:hypothetical protein [Candidatus Micrarchaeota archaeon]
MPNKNLEYLFVSIIYLAIALLIFWPTTINPISTVTGGIPNSVFPGTGDVFQNLWTLWWVNHAIFTLHQSPYSTNLLFAPYGSNLVTETLSPIAAILTLPFQAISLGFAYNIIFFLGFMLSGLFMFMLADHFTKNKYAAFIAGIVFAFSPFHIAHAGVGHLNWDSIEFVPLFILLIIKIVEERKLVYVLLASLAFTFLLFFGDPEQGIITIVFLLLYALVQCLNPKTRPQILNWGLAKSLGLVVVFTLIFSAPFLYYIVNGIEHGALDLANKYNTIKSYMISSVPITSFFLPSPFNDFFSSISKSYYALYIDNPTERVAYIGYVVLFLAYFGFRHDKKNKYLTTSFWIISALFFMYLAMGPYIQTWRYSGFGLSYFPGIYLVYSLIPIFNLVREPGRFDLIVTLSLAILAAIGTKALLETYKQKYKTKNFALYATALIALLILVEYNGIPVSSSFIHSYFIHLNISNGFSLLSNIPSNSTVMILPTIQNIGDDPTVFHPQVYSGMAMYFQTVFDKQMLGGYTSRVNDTQQLPLFQIPISVYGSFLQRGLNFQYASPVSENYTNVTMYFLGRYNISYVPVIKRAYNASNFTVLTTSLQSMFGAPYYSDNQTMIFYTPNAVSKSYLKSVVAYPSYGIWSPGCVVKISCTNLLNTFWYGTNVRQITVYVPPNMTHLSMNFSAVAYNSSFTLSVLVNSGPAYNYSLQNRVPIVPNLSLNLSPGLNQILFYSLPGQASSNYTYNFGIRDIKFVQR